MPMPIEWRALSFSVKVVHAFREKRTHNLVYRACGGDDQVGIHIDKLWNGYGLRKCRRCTAILKKESREGAER